MSPTDFCPVCGASVLVVQGDEGTAHYEPLDGHRAREWEQRWEGEKKRAERAEAELKALLKELADAVQFSLELGNVNP